MTIQVYYPTEQQRETLFYTELQTLDSLLAWCYVNQYHLADMFYRYAKETHYQPGHVFAYDRPHTTFSTVANSRVEYAVNLLLEGGIGCIELEGGNGWQPGKKVSVMGRSKDRYETYFNFQNDSRGASWAGFCRCDDWRVWRPDKHLIVAWILAKAYQELKK